MSVGRAPVAKIELVDVITVRQRLRDEYVRIDTARAQTNKSGFVLLHFAIEPSHRLIPTRRWHGKGDEANDGDESDDGEEAVILLVTND